MFFLQMKSWFLSEVILLHRDVLTRCRIIVGKSSTLCKQSNDPECMTSSPFFTRKDWKNHQGGAAEPPSVRSRRSRLHVISPVRCFISHGDGGWIHLGSFRFFWCGISWKQLEVHKVDESLLFWLLLQVGWFLHAGWTSDWAYPSWASNSFQQ